uniref:RNase H type-1 domain-containing protein n=1 Tax=Cannabis sativa TaxID=3483 RepID=A0A803NI18_CANSA
MCSAVVAGNHPGRIVWIQTVRLDFFDALCGDAAACCLALSIAKDMGSKFIIVESDSRVVINALNRKDSCWALDNYVSFCNSYSSLFSSCIFSNISRLCNFVTHNVANWTFFHQKFGVISVDSIPLELLCNDREV